MATRRTSRPSARWQTTRTSSARSLYRRPLRFEPLEDRRLLALVTVTTLEDSVDLNDGLTSLREAIFATNLVGGADTIDFAPALTAAGPAKILLTQGELAITDSLAINGPGAEILTIDAQSQSRIFNITATTGDFRIAALRLTHGQTTGNAGGNIFHGGAIRSLTRGTLELDRVSLIDNKTLGNGAQGGALFASGSVRISDSRVSGNSTSGNNAPGGGIAIPQPAAASVSVEIARSTISENRTTGAASSGGGILIGASASVTITETTITGNTTSGGSSRGGGLFAATSKLSLTDCVVTDNHTTGGSAEGGGLFASGQTGSTIMTIDQSLISGNSTSGLAAFGGGARLLGGQAIVLGSSIIGNSTSGIGAHGGGLHAGANQVSIRNSVISENKTTGAGAFGGGVRGAIVSIVGSLVSGNSTEGEKGGGGGVSVLGQLEIASSTVSNNHSNGVAAAGGGIHAPGTNHSISHSTITANSAAGSGGGIYTSAGPLPMALRHSIVAGNTAADGPDIRSIPGVLPAITTSFSLIGDKTGTALLEAPVGTPDANGNLIGGPVHGAINPLLAPLANNGGPTKTHALLPGSPAINAGNLNAQAGVGGVPLYDQRGEPFSRVFGGRIDIGAFERQELSDLNLLVDTLVDESDGNYSRGDLSLREAIELANLWQSTDTIRFDPALTTAGPATILLTKGELKITDDVAIIGPGANLLTIDASGSPGRIFNITDNNAASVIEVSLFGVTLTRGEVYDLGAAILTTETFRARNIVVTENWSRDGLLGSGGGGIAAILRNGASFELSDSTVSHNKAFNRGGGISLDIGANSSVKIDNSLIIANETTLVGAGSMGGGIFITSNLGDVRISGCTIADNKSPGRGGGIAFSGAVTIERTLVMRNSARYTGGGILHGSIGTVGVGALTLIDSQVLQNLASDGGGIKLGETSAVPHVIVRSRISQNTATGEIFSLPIGVRGVGGAIYVERGSVQIHDSTISENTAQMSGGGVYTSIFTGEFRLENSTVSHNSASSGGGLDLTRGGIVRGSTVSGNNAMTGGGIRGDGTISFSTIANNDGGGILGNVLLNHTIAAGNRAATGGMLDVSGVVNSQFSLIGSGAEFLGPLTNNGGPTMTHALLPGSPAINTGDPNAAPGVGGVPLYDQRGEPFKRVYGGRIDIGAVESQPNPLPGDYNFDGLVSSADFVVWQQTLGSTTDLRADGNGDGRVNEPDRAVWMANFGNVRLLVPAVTHETAEPSEIARRPVGTFDPSPAIVRRTTPTRVTARPVVTPATTAAVIRDKALEDSITTREKTAPRERVALRLALAALDQAFESPGIV